MKLVLTIFRCVLIFFNLLLINFHPSTDIEVKIFFASRLVFFLMLIIDYTHVAYYNKGLERLLGIAGFVVSIILAIIDAAGFFGFLVLENSKLGYTITGNDSNFLTGFIEPFSAQTYVFYSWLVVVVLLGLEVLNQGIRHIPSLINEPKENAA